MTPTTASAHGSGPDTRTLRRLTAVAAGALALGYLPMARWERRMRATGGPGIVGLQLACDATEAHDILATWGPEGRRAATAQTWADFAWMHTYGLTGALLVELARGRAPASSAWASTGRAVRWLPYAAVAFDVAEGVGQLRTLRAWPGVDEAAVSTTRRAATVKYALLAAAAGWSVGAVALGGRRPGGR